MQFFPKYFCFFSLGKDSSASLVAFNLGISLVSVSFTSMCLSATIFIAYPNRTCKIVQYFSQEQKNASSKSTNKRKTNAYSLSLVSQFSNYFHIKPRCKSLKHIFDGLFIWYGNYPGFRNKVENFSYGDIISISSVVQ